MNQLTRSTIRALSLAILAACCAGNALAATATAPSTSTVIVPIAIAKTADLTFGKLAAGGTAGSVTVSPNGARSFSGGTTTGGGTSSAAQFNVTGEPGLTYSITLGGTQLTSGANNLAFTTVSDTTASSITTGNVTSGTLTGGAQSIFVGGTLTVGANQAPGAYSGSVTATVDYN
jgi:hypothetical protein